jgi:aminocarboxymuconate-semialdehyde decarboxylase
VRPDVVAAENRTSPRHYLAHDDVPARFYVDSHVHDADALRLLLKLFGAERVAFGSDYPFSLGETHPGELIKSMDLAEKEKAQLFFGTVREFLRL